jgi:tetratricopeptide (TPR) repeat protein
LNLNTKHKQEQDIQDVLDTALNRIVTMCDMYYNRALVYLFLYDYESALADFETIIKLTDQDKSQRSNLPQYVFAHGVALYYYGNVEESITKFSSAIDLANSEYYNSSFSAAVPSYLVHRACAYDRLYQSKEANEDREQAIKLKPEINATPFHIRLLSDDAVAHVLSFLDRDTCKATALTCRQINAIVEKMEYNPFWFMDKCILQLHQSNLANHPKLLTLDAGHVKRILSDLCTLDSMGDLTRIETDYDQVLTAWLNHDKEKRIEQYHRLKEYFDNMDATTKYHLPKSFEELLQREHLTLGKLLFRLMDLEPDQMYYVDTPFHDRVDGQGPTVTLHAQHDWYKCGYTSVSWSNSGGYKYDDKAWLYDSFANNVCRVKVPEKAVYHTSDLPFCFGNESMTNSSFTMKTQYLYIHKEGDIYDGWNDYLGHAYNIYVFQVHPADEIGLERKLGDINLNVQ